MTAERKDFVDPSSGRIESYIHSDSITSNKGGAVVKVTCQTDFAAKTDEFIAFAKKAALMSYAANALIWLDVAEQFPDVELERIQLETTLKERVNVGEIRVLIL